jgi:hypothetical protein
MIHGEKSPSGLSDGEQSSRIPKQNFVFHYKTLDESVKQSIFVILSISNNPEATMYLSALFGRLVDDAFFKFCNFKDHIT